MEQVLPKMGITCTVLDPDDLSNLESVIEEKRPSLFFSESPTNPFMRCFDISRISRACRKVGTVLSIDSTFATPINQQPLALGADLVLHSATKYLGGHNDVLGGAVAGSSELVSQIRSLHGVLGGVLDPHAAYLLVRGMKTLSVRVERQNRTALAMARLLESDAMKPYVERVYYPGLESHPDHAVAASQMGGFGGVVSFVVRGGLKPASDFVDSLRIPYIAPSLGGVESLVEQPAIISYWDQTPENRLRLGIADGLIRFSCGIENTDDILLDVEQAIVGSVAAQ